MEYRDDDRRLFGEDRPGPVKRFLRFWSSVIAVVLALWVVSAFMLDLERRALPAKSEPVAEKLTLHRSFVIACDATMAQRGASEKWSAPSCYMRGAK